MTPEQVNRAFGLAMQSMSTLNREAARLMHTHGAHAATDVTGAWAKIVHAWLLTFFFSRFCGDR